MNHTRYGHVAIVGRPNVGKSTLLNRILGQKLSITSRKPQTTRQRIQGIKTAGICQTIYIDTPGLHLGRVNALNRYMNRAATAALEGVDAVLFVIEHTKWTEEDQVVLNQMTAVCCPVFLVVNKVDTVKDKEHLLPFMQTMMSTFQFAEIFPVSAKNGHNIAALQERIHKLLPVGVHGYAEDQITDRSSRFLIAELIREKIMRLVGEELPYSATVQIEYFKVQNGISHIHALIWVERLGQKKILIGERGERMKAIGSQARQAMEVLLGGKVMLNLWVKVKAGWADDERVLKSLGYHEL